MLLIEVWRLFREDKQILTLPVPSTLSSGGARRHVECASSAT